VSPREYVTRVITAMRNGINPIERPDTRIDWPFNKMHEIVLHKGGLGPHALQYGMVGLAFVVDRPFFIRVDKQMRHSEGKTSEYCLVTRMPLKMPFSVVFYEPLDGAQNCRLTDGRKMSLAAYAQEVEHLLTEMSVPYAKVGMAAARG
jgi:hypothetical protein